MKPALLILMTVLCADAYAQPVYRCDDGLGHVSYQDKLCPEQTEQRGNDQAASSHAVTRMSASEVASYQQPVNSQRDWNYYQRKQRRQQETVKAHTETLRLRTLLAPSSDFKTVEYADNQRRCQNAMRVAALCGKSVGTFSCDEKGFHHESLTDVSVLNGPVTENGSAYNIQQCSLRAANGGS